jgi:hypothetical protein
VFGSVVDGGGIMHLRGGTMYLQLFRTRDFFLLVLFFYNHIMLVTVMNVIIFQCVHTFTFLCGTYQLKCPTCNLPYISQTDR